VTTFLASLLLFAVKLRVYKQKVCKSINPFYTMTTFLTYFMDSKRSKPGSGILEFHFFVSQNFDCEPRYACFSIFLCLHVAFLFLHLYSYNFFLCKALSTLNPNLFKFLWYHHRFSSYGKKSLIFLTVHFTVHEHFLKQCNFLVHPWNDPLFFSFLIFPFPSKLKLISLLRYF
jgi:hypothetical protein